MFTYNSIFKDSPLTNVTLNPIPLDMLKVGEEIAISTILRSINGTFFTETFIIDKVVRITPKRTKITLEKSGERTAKQLMGSTYKVIPEILTHINQSEKRNKLCDYLYEILRSNVSLTSAEKMYILRNLHYQVLNLTEQETDLQLKVFNAVDTLEKTYIKAILDQKKKEEQIKIEKYGVKK